MSSQAYNKIFKDQQKKLVKSTFKKAFVNSVNISSRTVDIYFAENPQTIVRNVPVADGITLSTSLINKRCRVDLFDESNPSDMVMAFTY